MRSRGNAKQAQSGSRRRSRLKMSLKDALTNSAFLSSTSLDHQSLWPTISSIPLSISLLPLTSCLSCHTSQRCVAQRMKASRKSKNKVCDLFFHIFSSTLISFIHTFVDELSRSSPPPPKPTVRIRRGSSIPQDHSSRRRQRTPSPAQDRTSSSSRAHQSRSGSPSSKRHRTRTTTRTAKMKGEGKGKGRTVEEDQYSDVEPVSQFLALHRQRKHSYVLGHCSAWSRSLQRMRKERQVGMSPADVLHSLFGLRPR